MAAWHQRSWTNASMMLVAAHASFCVCNREVGLYGKHSTRVPKHETTPKKQTLDDQPWCTQKSLDNLDAVPGFQDWGASPDPRAPVAVAPLAAAAARHPHRRAAMHPKHWTSCWLHELGSPHFDHRATSSLVVLMHPEDNPLMLILDLQSWDWTPTTVLSSKCDSLPFWSALKYSILLVLP